MAVVVVGVVGVVVTKAARAMGMVVRVDLVVAAVGAGMGVVCSISGALVMAACTAGCDSFAAAAVLVSVVATLMDFVVGRCLVFMHLSPLVPMLLSAVLVLVVIALKVVFVMFVMKVMCVVVVVVVVLLVVVAVMAVVDLVVALMFYVRIFGPGFIHFNLFNLILSESNHRI